MTQNNIVRTSGRPTGLLQTGLVLLTLVCVTPEVMACDDGNKKKPRSPVTVKTETRVGAEARKEFSVRKMDQQEQVAFARQDLASRLGINIDEIKVSGAISVTWRSGALGCPKPGMNYTQALVPGRLLMLTVDNKAYRYHASPDGEPFHCPDDMAESQYLNSSDA